MARVQSPSMMLPAVDRGVSMRRKVVPGRSLARTVIFVGALVALIVAAVLLYLNRWQDAELNAHRSAPNILDLQDAEAAKEKSQSEAIQIIPEGLSSPLASISGVVEKSSVDLRLDGLSATRGSQISPDGSSMLIRAFDGALTLVVGEERKELGFETPPLCFTYAKHNPIFACGFADGSVAVVSSQTGETIARRRVHRGALSDVAFVHGGETLLTSAKDGYVRELVPQTLVEKRRTSFGEPVVAVAASSDEGLCWALGEDGTLRTYSLIAFVEVSSTQLAVGASVAVASGLGVVTFTSGELCVRDPSSLEVLWKRDGFNIESKLREQGTSVSLVENGRLLLLARSNKGEVETRAIDTKGEIASLSADLRNALVLGNDGSASRIQLG